MIYSNTLKNLLKEIFSYDEITDSFINITSKYLPIESDFIKFWEKTIIIDEQNTLVEEELEIDELCMLFKNWVKQQPTLTTSSIGEKYLIFKKPIPIRHQGFILFIFCFLRRAYLNGRFSFSLTNRAIPVQIGLDHYLISLWMDLKVIVLCQK
jgi:hypothetical protein